MVKLPELVLLMEGAKLFDRSQIASSSHGKHAACLPRLDLLRITEFNAACKYWLPIRRVVLPIVVLYAGSGDPCTRTDLLALARNAAACMWQII
jgi:hypothetical protein